MAQDMSFLNRTYMMMVLFPKLGLEAYTGVRIEKITSQNVVMVDREGKKRKIRADSVVNALGYQPDTALFRKLKAEDWEVYAIGDCVKARKVVDAVYDGASIARGI